MSSGFTSPFFSSSALPRMDCSGVFSSWDTLAVNSRRLRSAQARSVTSKASRTTPTAVPSGWIRLKSNWYSRPPRWERMELRPSSRAARTARLISGLGSTVRKLRPAQERSTPKTACAAGLTLSTAPSRSNTTSPSLMWLVICSNSSVFARSSRSWALIWPRCWWTRRRRGVSSS